MLNYIWAGLILISYIFAIINGRVELVTQAALSGAGDAVKMIFSLLGIMCFWTGLLQIAKKSKLTDKFAKLITPLTRLLFPELKEGSNAINAIVMNMMANILGLSNAATPLGLKAMEELDKENGGDSVASNAMCMFVVINTAALDLIPTTVIALRSAAGSQNPFEIIVPAWISSVISIICGVCAAKIFSKTQKRYVPMPKERLRGLQCK